MKKFFIFIILFQSFLTGDYIFKPLKPRKEILQIIKKDTKVRKRFVPFLKNKGKLIIKAKELDEKGLLRHNTLKQNDTAKIHILAIRVGFQKEEPDDTLTTGNGWFDLIGNKDAIGDTNSLFYDPPHNKRYFELYLASLKNYIYAMSYGKVKIEYTVKPDSADSFYILPYSMRYYGDTINFDIGLMKLFRDALVLADRDTSINFMDLNNNGIKDYNEGIKNSYIIFHAGSTWQTDVFWDTPFDIATVTIPQGAIEYYFKTPFILLNNQKDTVSGGIILPETGSQDGLFVTLHGLLFHEFIHDAFYFPDLYDIYGGSTGVGAWDIMGAGGWNEVVAKKPDGDTARITGIVPSSFCAWSKVWMDQMVKYMVKRYFDPSAWEKDTLFYPVDFLWPYTEVVAGKIDSAIGSGPPLSFDIFPNNLKITDTSNFLPLPDSSLRILYVPIDYREYFLIEYRLTDIFGYDSLPIFKKGGVFLSPLGAYDYLLPGSGILIWHIDENIVYNYYSELNSNPVHKGVDIEEADGIQDLDQWTVYPYTWFGSPFDPFFNGNNNKFGTYTNPNSDSWTESHSFIQVFDISDKGNPTMSFKIGRQNYVPGYPMSVDTSLISSGYSFKETYIDFIDADGNGEKELFLTGTETLTFYGDSSFGGRIYAKNKDGSFYGIPDTAYISFAQEKILYPPVFADFNSDGTKEIVLLTDRKMHIYTLEKPTFVPFPGFDTLNYPQFSSPSTLFDITQDGVPEILISGEDAFIYCIEPASGIPYLWRTFVGAPARGAIAVIEKEDKYYFVVLTEDGRVYILNKDGIEEQGSPFLFPSLITTRTSPVIADFDSDGEYEIFVIRGDGYAFFLSNAGEIEGEKYLGPGKFTSPAAGDFDKDGFYEVFFVKDALLIGLNHTGSFVRNFPLKIKNDTLLSPYKSPIFFDLTYKQEAMPSLAFPDSLRINQVFYSLEKSPLFPVFTGTLGTGNYIIDDYEQKSSSDSLEIFIFSKTGEIHILQLNIKNPVWGRFAGNPQHTSFIREKLEATPIEKHELKIYLYPSLVRGNSATLRVFSKTGGVLKLQLWSYAGIKLKNYEFNLKGGDFEEFNLDLADLASGPYILKWKKDNKNQYFKFTIVK